MYKRRNNFYVSKDLILLGRERQRAWERERERVRAWEREREREWEHERERKRKRAWKREREREHERKRERVRERKRAWERERARERAREWAREAWLFERKSDLPVKFQLPSGAAPEREEGMALNRFWMIFVSAAAAAAANQGIQFETVDSKWQQQSRWELLERMDLKWI